MYCIDYSGIIKHTKKIITANGFGDTITAIRSKVEELTLPVEKVTQYFAGFLNMIFLFVKINSITL